MKCVNALCGEIQIDIWGLQGLHVKDSDAEDLNPQSAQCLNGNKFGDYSRYCAFKTYIFFFFLNRIMNLTNCYVTQKKIPCMPFMSAASHQPSISELISNPATLIFCVFKKIIYCYIWINQVLVGQFLLEC